MIITILPSSTTFHAIAYNEKKVEKGQASLIEAANIGLRQEAYTADNLREYFELYSARNTRIQNTQFHVAVSCKGNEYSYEQLLDIAHCYLKEMGYAEEGQPLLVYAHCDTPNNHIHIITSRVAPDGHRISDKFEKKRSREVCERIMQQYHSQRAGQNIDGQQTTAETTNADAWNEALTYRYTSNAQFYAILESMGYDCKEDEQDYSVNFYKNNTCQGKLSLQEILRHAIKENRPENRRRQQLRAILQKYRNLSANKEELAAQRLMVISLLTTKTKLSSKAVSFSASRNCTSSRMPPHGLPRLKRPLTSCLPTILSSPRQTLTAYSIGSLVHVSIEEQCRGTVRPSTCASQSSVNSMTITWSRKELSSRSALITSRQNIRAMLLSLAPVLQSVMLQTVRLVPRMPIVKKRSGMA